MIQVDQLTKSFGEIKAVNGISFDINKGEIYGLLGPNGAGKSTTINMLSDLFKPDSGTIHLNNTDLFSETNSCKKIIGIVPQEISLYDELSAEENLLFFGEIYGIPTKKLKNKIHDLLEFIGLSSRKKDAIKTYSGGMKRRVNIAAALLHEPKILFLDEPTVGVDPQSRNRIFEIIERLKSEGLTIIYTTHYMEEVERLCDRIAIIDEGRIVGQGTLEELKKMTGEGEIVELDFATSEKEKIEELKTILPFKAEITNNKLAIKCDKNKDLKEVLNQVSKLNLNIANIDFLAPNLERVFLHLTGKELRD